MCFFLLHHNLAQINIEFFLEKLSFVLSSSVVEEAYPLPSCTVGNSEILENIIICELSYLMLLLKVINLM